MPPPIRDTNVALSLDTSAVATSDAASLFTGGGADDSSDTNPIVGRQLMAPIRGGADEMGAALSTGGKVAGSTPVDTDGSAPGGPSALVVALADGAALEDPFALGDRRSLLRSFLSRLSGRSAGRASAGPMAPPTRKSASTVANALCPGRWVRQPRGDSVASRRGW